NPVVSPVVAATAQCPRRRKPTPPQIRAHPGHWRARHKEPSVPGCKETILRAGGRWRGLGSAVLRLGYPAPPGFQDTARSSERPESRTPSCVPPRLATFVLDRKGILKTRRPQRARGEYDPSENPSEKLVF